MIWEFFIISRNIKRKIAKIFTNKEDKILDLGCGEFPYYHKYINGNIVCLDIKKTKITDIVSDADNLPLKADSFDKILSVNSFYYLKNPFNVVKDLHKILKKEGKLILVLPFFYPIHDAPLDKFRFTEYGLRNLLDKYFKIERLEAIGGIFNIPAVILHSLIKGLPLLFPKRIGGMVQIILYGLYPFYIIAQFVSILDVFDKTGRFPTYYFVVARKK